MNYCEHSLYTPILTTSTYQVSKFRFFLQNSPSILRRHLLSDSCCYPHEHLQRTKERHALMSHRTAPSGCQSKIRGMYRWPSLCFSHLFVAVAALRWWRQIAGLTSLPRAGTAKGQRRCTVFCGSVDNIGPLLNTFYMNIINHSKKILFFSTFFMSSIFFYNYKFI